MSDIVNLEEVRQARLMHPTSEDEAPIDLLDALQLAAVQLEYSQEFYATGEAVLHHLMDHGFTEHQIEVASQLLVSHVNVAMNDAFLQGFGLAKANL